MVRSGAPRGEAPGGCKGAAPGMAGPGLGPGGAERAVSACPLWGGGLKTTSKPKLVSFPLLPGF